VFVATRDPGEEEAHGAGISDLDLTTPLPTPRDVDHGCEPERRVEDELASRAVGHRGTAGTLQRSGPCGDQNAML
jgi:hypothetical protein